MKQHERGGGRDFICGPKRLISQMNRFKIRNESNVARKLRFDRSPPAADAPGTRGCRKVRSHGLQTSSDSLAALVAWWTSSRRHLSLPKLAGRRACLARSAAGHLQLRWWELQIKPHFFIFFSLGFFGMFHFRLYAAVCCCLLLCALRAGGGVSAGRDREITD